MSATLSICVCTFRRPQLADTLRSLGRLALPPGERVEIVVADNDAAPSAKDLVDREAAALRIPVRYVHAPGANISIARNACLDAAEGGLVAFIDDDETARPNWLAELVATLRREDAAAVLGPVRAVYAADAPAWMRESDIHSTYPVFVRGEIRTGYTCNVLVDRRASAAAPLRFDLARGRTGGEDTDYFTRLTRAGGRIAYAPEAWVDEPVPAARARLSWLARRRFRMGQTHGHLLVGHGAGRLSGAGLAAAKAGACLAMAAATLAVPSRARGNLLRGLLHVGAASGFLGVGEIALYGAPASEEPARAA